MPHLTSIFNTFLTRLAKPVVTAVLLLVVSACTKGRFPKQNFLIGTWLEESAADFQHKLVFDHEKMVFIKKNSTDTFTYELDREQKLLKLMPFSDPSAAQGTYSIKRSNFKKEITVYGFFITRGDESETVFKKE